MSLKSIFREVRKTLTIWIPIGEPPEWVQKAHSHFIDKVLHFHGDKYYTGRNHIYKVHMEEHRQGDVVEKWYVKTRIR